MSDIIKYAESYFERIEQTGLSDVDSLIFSEIAYVNFPDAILPQNLESPVKFTELFRAEFFTEMFMPVLESNKVKLLFTAMAASPRFRDIKLSHYIKQTDNSLEKQFSAVTYSLGNGDIYIAFRGTDSSFTGWKEDFNLALDNNVIPSQDAALQYIEKVAECYNGKIYVGGHSKGGNLAVFAAARCSDKVKDRIVNVFSHDGPGFSEEWVNSEAFLSIRDRIRKTVPQSSAVGMMFEQEAELIVVKSSSFSIGQHNPFSWVLEDNKFITLTNITPEAKLLTESVNTWLDEMSDDDKEEVSDFVFHLLETTKVYNFTELKDNILEFIPQLIKEYKDADVGKKKNLQAKLKEFAAIGIKNIRGRDNDSKKKLESKNDENT